MEDATRTPTVGYPCTCLAERRLPQTSATGGLHAVKCRDRLYGDKDHPAGAGAGAQALISRRGWPYAARCLKTSAGNYFCSPRRLRRTNSSSRGDGPCAVSAATAFLPIRTPRGGRGGRASARFPGEGGLTRRSAPRRLLLQTHADCGLPFSRHYFSSPRYLLRTRLILLLLFSSKVPVDVVATAPAPVLH